MSILELPTTAIARIFVRIDLSCLPINQISTYTWLTMKNNQRRFIGKLEVSPIGLGCMPLSGYPPEKSFMLDNRDQAIQICSD